MRILWVSDSPNHPSGYGTVTANVCRRLHGRGHEVTVLGWQTSAAGTDWNGIRLLPAGQDRYGADVLSAYLEDVRPDCLVTLGDVYAMSYLAAPSYRRLLDTLGIRWILYYPVDGATPEGRLPENWTDVLAAVDVRVTMAEFGREVTAACGLDAECILHGIDSDLFRPPVDKRRMKERLGYEDTFVILSDAQSQPRKLIPRTLEIAARFLRRHDDAVLHLHCDPYEAPYQEYRYNIPEDVAALGLTGRVRFTQGFRMGPDGGLTAAQMADLYAAADVHLLCSYGEGFGLPTLQAAAAGVPPIAVDYSASRELVGDHGFAVPAEAVVVDNAGFARHLMNRDVATGALERMYQSRDELAERSSASRTFALNLGWDAIADQWERVLTSDTRHREAESTGFPHGKPRKGQLRIPVWLPGEFAAAADGWILGGPGDAALVERLQRLFTGLEAAEAGEAGSAGSVEEHLGTLLNSLAVVDFAPGGVPGVDQACAALGIPYAGRSALWPATDAPDPFLQARRLLTDQGLSQWRRAEALRTADRELGSRAIDRIRHLARAAAERPSL